MPVNLQKWSMATYCDVLEGMGSGGEPIFRYLLETSSCLSVPVVAIPLPAWHLKSSVHFVWVLKQYLGSFSEITLQ